MATTSEGLCNIEANMVLDQDQRDLRELSLWYHSLSPTKVDVVGDFAGKGLFAIHGDSLLLYCTRRAKVDMDSMSA